MRDEKLIGDMLDRVDDVADEHSEDEKVSLIQDVLAWVWHSAYSDSVITNHLSRYEKEAACDGSL